MDFLEQRADEIRGKLKIVKEQIENIEKECQTGLNLFDTRLQITDRITKIDENLGQIRDDINGLGTKIPVSNPTEKLILQRAMACLLQECMEVIEKLKQIQRELLQSKSRFAYFMLLWLVVG
jgi:chromosome segregation ATPase